MTNETKKMKKSLHVRLTKLNRNHKRLTTLASALLLTAAPVATVKAADATAPGTNAPPAEAKPAKAEKGNPLPLHQIEGNGGIFSTLSAYIVNPPRNGEQFGVYGKNNGRRMWLKIPKPLIIITVTRIK